MPANVQTTAYYGQVPWHGLGNEVPMGEYPWFWGWDGNTEDFMGGPEFKGERFNACHYTIEAKLKARDAERKEKG